MGRTENREEECRKNTMEIGHDGVSPSAVGNKLPRRSLQAEIGANLPLPEQEYQAAPARRTQLSPGK